MSDNGDGLEAVESVEDKSVGMPGAEADFAEEKDFEDWIPSDTLSRYRKEMEKYSLLPLEEEQRLGWIVQGCLDGIIEAVITAPFDLPKLKAMQKLAWLVVERSEAQDENRVGVEAFLKVLGRFLNEPDDASNYSHAKLKEWISCVREQNDKMHSAKNKLVTANLGIVWTIAKKYLGKGLKLPELLQEGNCGLIKASLRFDPSLGWKFITLADWRIGQSIRKAICDQARTIRIPMYLHELFNRTLRAFSDLAKELGREPDFGEVAKRTGLPEKKTRFLWQSFQNIVHIDSFIKQEEKEGTLEHYLKDDDGLAEKAEQQNLTEEVVEILCDTHNAKSHQRKKISARDAEILRLRFGINEKRKYPLEKVSTILVERGFSRKPLSRERIRQLEGKALKRLHKSQRARQLAVSLGIKIT